MEAGPVPVTPSSKKLTATSLAGVLKALADKTFSPPQEFELFFIWHLLLLLLKETQGC